MIIEKIEIESFASHSNTEIELSDGVNLIEGDNESGKSSLADFIKFVLYGAAGKASDGHLAERKRVMNFNSSYMAGALCVRCGERRLRITRNTAVSGSVRESVRTRISVIDRDTGEDIYDGTEPGVMLLGIPEELFCSSVYLSQRQGNAVGASVNESISNILFSGDERMSADRAIERIEQARIPLSHKHGRVGRIYDIKDELASLERKLSDETEKNERIARLDASLKEKKKTNSEHIGNYVELEKKKRAYELSKIIESCEALADAEREKAESELSLLEYKGSVHIPTDSETEELYAYERSLRLLEKREAELSGEREELLSERVSLEPSLSLSSYADTDVVGEIRGYAKAKTRFTSLAWTFAAIFLLGLAAAVLLLPVLIAAAGAALLLCLVFFALRAKNAGKIKNILTLADCKDADELEGAVEKCREALARQAELDASLDENARESCECDEIARLERARFSEYLAMMDIDGEKCNADYVPEIAGTFRVRVSHANELEAAARERRAYFDALMRQAQNADVDAARRELDSLGVDSPDSLDPDKLDRNIAFYREQSALLSDKIHSLELELAELRATVSAPAAIYERITYLESELSSCERKLAVYQLASEGLKKASEELRRSVAPTLARIAGGYMDSLTGGRYSEVSLDSALALSYSSGGEMRHIDHMSTGTRDAAYLSLRLALGDVISGKGALPVILDEATAHMDDARAEALISLLCERAEAGHQHILFTCHKRECEILGRIGREFKHIVLGE